MSYPAARTAPRHHRICVNTQNVNASSNIGEKLHCIAHLSVLREGLHCNKRRGERDGVSLSRSGVAARIYLGDKRNIPETTKKPSFPNISACKDGEGRGGGGGGERARSRMRKEAGTERERAPELLLAARCFDFWNCKRANEGRGKRKKLISGHFVELSISRSGVISKAEFSGQFLWTFSTGLKWKK